MKEKSRTISFGSYEATNGDLIYYQMFSNIVSMTAGFNPGKVCG
jgi:hypothetical protein